MLCSRSRGLDESFSFIWIGEEVVLLVLGGFFGVLVEGDDVGFCMILFF